jgi:hypothetical protein
MPKRRRGRGPGLLCRQTQRRSVPVLRPLTSRTKRMTPEGPIRRPERGGSEWELIKILLKNLAYAPKSLPKNLAHLPRSRSHNGPTDPRNKLNQS